MTIEKQIEKQFQNPTLHFVRADSEGLVKFLPCVYWTVHKDTQARVLLYPWGIRVHRVVIGVVEETFHLFLYSDGDPFGDAVSWLNEG